MSNPDTFQTPEKATTERSEVRSRSKPNCPIDREWLGFSDLKRYANISERTLRSWIYAPVDSLPATKVSGKVLVRKSDFDAYLERHRITPLEEFNLDAIVEDVVRGEAHER